MCGEGEGQLAPVRSGTDPTATSLRRSMGSAPRRTSAGLRGGGQAAPRTWTHLWTRPAGSGPGTSPSPAEAAVAQRGLDGGAGLVQPWTALGPGRGSLCADGAAASRDWERGWSKNVSYSSVFLPGPAPPLPPNKPFPIAQLADRLSARPLLGPQGPDHPPHGSQTPRAAAPCGRQPPLRPPRPGIAVASRPEPPTSASPRGRALDSGSGGLVGTRPGAMGPGAEAGGTI